MEEAWTFLIQSVRENSHTENELDGFLDMLHILTADGLLDTKRPDTHCPHLNVTVEIKTYYLNVILM